MKQNLYHAAAPAEASKLQINLHQSSFFIL